MHRSMLVLIAFASACGAPDRDLNGLAASDSAGVTIVGANAEAIQGLPVLTLGDVEPVFGYDESDASGVLERVQSVMRHAGAVVIGDAGSRDLIVMRDGGTPIRVGRPGSGPGEFRNLSDVFAWSGDSVLVFDSSWPRVTVFSLEGGSPRTFPLQAPEGTFAPLLRGAHPGVGLLLESMLSPLDRVPDEPYWQRSRLWFTNPEGRDASEVADQRGFVLSAFTPPSGGGPAIRVWPHSPQGKSIMGRGRVFVADGDRFVVSQFSSDGRLERRFRMEEAPRALSDDVLRAEAREQLGDEVSDEQVERFVGLNRERGIPETLPEISRMFLDDAGNLWAQRYRMPGEAESTWLVLNQDLQPVAWLRVPRSVILHQAESGRVHGVWVDELGRQVVRTAELLDPECAVSC